MHLKLIGIWIHSNGTTLHDSSKVISTYRTSLLLNKQVCMINRSLLFQENIVLHRISFQPIHFYPGFTNDFLYVDFNVDSTTFHGNSFELPLTYHSNIME